MGDLFSGKATERSVIGRKVKRQGKINHSNRNRGLLFCGVSRIPSRKYWVYYPVDNCYFLRDIVRLGGRNPEEFNDG